MTRICTRPNEYNFLGTIRHILLSLDGIIKKKSSTYPRGRYLYRRRLRIILYSYIILYLLVISNSFFARLRFRRFQTFYGFFIDFCPHRPSLRFEYDLFLFVRYVLTRILQAFNVKKYYTCMRSPA